MFCIILEQASGVPLGAAGNHAAAVGWLVDNFGCSLAEVRQGLADGDLRLVEIEGDLPDDWEDRWDIYDLERIAGRGEV